MNDDDAGDGGDDDRDDLGNLAHDDNVFEDDGNGNDEYSEIDEIGLLDLDFVRGPDLESLRREEEETRDQEQEQAAEADPAPSNETIEPRVLESVSFPIDLIRGKAPLVDQQQPPPQPQQQQQQQQQQQGAQAFGHVVSAEEPWTAITMASPPPSTRRVRFEPATPMPSRAPSFSSSDTRRRSRGTFLERKDIVDEAANFVARASRNTARSQQASSAPSAGPHDDSNQAASAMFKVLFEHEDRRRGGRIDAPATSRRPTRQGSKVKAHPLQNLATSYEHADPFFCGFCVDDHTPQQLPAAAFCSACIAGDLEAVATALDTVSSAADRARLVRWKDHLGRTALHRLAALSALDIMPEHYDILDRLLGAGAYPDERDRTGWTPLFYAVQHNHLDAIDHFCDYGANLRLRDDPRALKMATRDDFGPGQTVSGKSADEWSLAALEDTEPRSLFRFCRDLGFSTTLKHLVDISTIRFDYPCRLLNGFRPLFRTGAGTGRSDAFEDAASARSADSNDDDDGYGGPEHGFREQILIRWKSATRTEDFDLYFHVVETVAGVSSSDAPAPISPTTSRPDKVEEAIRSATQLMQKRIQPLHRFQIMPGYDIEAKQDLLGILHDTLMEDEAEEARRASQRSSVSRAMSAGSFSPAPPKGRGLSTPSNSARFGLEMIGRAVSSRTIESHLDSSAVPSLFSLHLGRVQNESEFHWALPADLSDCIPRDALAIFEVRCTRNESISGFSEVFPVFS